MKQNKTIRFLPALIWMIVIFYFSSRSTSGVPVPHDFQFVFFKSLHLIEYAILGFLLLFAFLNFKYTLITGYLYAISDEIHQRFVPGRGSKFTDTIFDLVGIILGIFLFKLIYKFRVSRK